MKKNIFAALAFLGLVLAGCSKEEILPTSEPEVTPPAAKITTLTATLPDNATSRTAFNETEAALKVTWAEGDKITLYDETGAATEFNMKEGSLSSDGKTAKFEGEIDAEKSYTAVYPANAGKDAEAWKTFLAANTATQDMTEGKETNHLAQNVIMTSSLAAGSTALSFTSKVAIMKVIATLPNSFAEKTPVSVSIKGAWGEKAYSVALENATSAIAAYIVTPTEETVADVTLSAQIKFGDSNEITYTMPVKNTAIENKLYSVKTSKATTGTLNGHAWVDIGLTNLDGRRYIFATKNIGAKTETDFGYYFRYGEQCGWEINLGNLSPYGYGYEIISAKQYDINGAPTTAIWTDETFGYYWEMYGLVVEDFKGLINQNSKGHIYGDAATYNWGDGWFMMDQYILIDILWSWRISKYWDSINGVNGYRIVNTQTGNSFFLPAGGYCNSSYLKGLNNGGNYLTSSPKESDACSSYGLGFDSTDINYGVMERIGASSIRPMAVLPASPAE